MEAAAKALLNTVGSC